MKSLLLWGEGRRAAPDPRADQVVQTWAEDGATSRGADGDAVEETAMAWVKDFGRRRLVDGQRFRDLLAWEDVPLWWLAEVYLYHSTQVSRYVRLVERFHRLLETERPEEVEAAGLDEPSRRLLARTCLAKGILFHDPTGGRPERARIDGAAVARVRLESRWNALKAALGALKSALAGAPTVARPPEDRARVLFLSHAAFWHEREEAGASETYEHYFDRLIPDVAADPALEAFVLAVGPRAAFRRRGPAQRVAEWARLPSRPAPFVHLNRFWSPRLFGRLAGATEDLRALWNRLRVSPALTEAFSHRGVSFADLAQPDLAATLLLQLPWAVRSYLEITAALQAVQPAVVCLYAESSGWGRVAVLACRPSPIPTVALQHGIVYRDYFSYRHGPDEPEAPRPDRTAVFGDGARRLLLDVGGYAPASLVVTGSPRFDALVAAARGRDRGELRRRLGVAEGERLVVVASRYRAIRDTHASIGSAFPSLVRALEALPGVVGLVKPHPAEPAAEYERDLAAAAATRTRLVAPGADLMELLQAADALVTVESLSAVEALVLGRGLVVLNMPTHLRELVEAGVGLGVAAGEDPRAALESVLFDAATAERLAAARLRYLDELARGVDGQASARILSLLRETAVRRDMLGC